MALEAGFDLARTQRWLQAVVAQPGTTDDGLRSSEATAELLPERIGDLVLPSRTLSPMERIEVYQRMYFLRMRDALEVDYPGLRHALGRGGFAALVQDYVRVHPSRSYTLNRLGDHLPAYIAGQTGLKRSAFLRDLARLEWTMTQVFDAPSEPSLEEEAIAAVPPSAWAGARLRPIAAFRLLTLDWPAAAWLQALHDESPLPALRRKRTWAAIYRRDHRVHRLELDRTGHDLLARLGREEPLGDAVASALGRQRRIALSELHAWFREWTTKGLFAAVEWS